MRKLLLGTTALVASSAILANTAVADVSISAGTEWKYISYSSTIAANDGTRFDTDSEIAFKFTNKTDSGLTIGYVAELETDADGTATTDESSISISGGFGKLVLGDNDGVGDNYGIESEDAIAEETGVTLPASASISMDTDIAGMSGDANKVAYHIPAMGGFTAGMSVADNGAMGAMDTKTDTTAYGAKYTMEAAGNTITLGAASATTDAAVGVAKDTDSQNMGIKVVSGNLTVIVAKGSSESVGEDIEATGAAVSYKLANGMILGAYTTKAEDDLDKGEEFTKSGVELQYTVAAGLTAVINVDDYEYTQATTGSDTGSDSGTISKLTLKASF